MATLSDLVSALASVIGLPEATVFAYGRFAREAGYIAQGGRGRGGARMTVADAANLVVAIGGTRITREAGDAIKAFRGLRGNLEPRYHGFPQIERWLAKYRESYPSRDYFEFGSFLDFLIAESMSSELEPLLRSLPVHDVPENAPDFWEIHERFTEDHTSVPLKASENINLFEDIILEIEFVPNFGQASISLQGFGLIAYHFFAVRFGAGERGARFGDLATSSTITQRTLLSVGRCLSGAV
jgi:hypothetical protein